MIQLLKVTTWLFMGLAVVFFWLSLRSLTDNMEYTLYALAMILIAWGSNFMLKRQENQEGKD